MFWPKGSVETVASGHRMLRWPTAGHLFYVVLCWKLRLRHGLRRTGRQVVLYPDVLLPDFVGGDLRLNSGWDNWNGYHLVSMDEPGDLFLERLASEMGLLRSS
jgi:hypothetical protein